MTYIIYIAVEFTNRIQSGLQYSLLTEYKVGCSTITNRIQSGLHYSLLEEYKVGCITVY